MRLMSGATNTPIPNIPAHTKTEWATGDTITAVKLNNLEVAPGIFWVNVATDTSSDTPVLTPDKTFEETYSALLSGMLPMLKVDANEKTVFASLLFAQLLPGSNISQQLTFSIGDGALVWDSNGLKTLELH